MRAYEKSLTRSLIGFLLMMVACCGDNGGSTGVNDGDDGGSQDGDTRRHMLLQVTSGNPPRGGVFDVQPISPFGGEYLRLANHRRRRRFQVASSVRETLLMHPDDT